MKKQLILGLLVVSLMAGSIIYAGSGLPAFDRALTKGKLIQGHPETEKNFTGRLKIMYLWFVNCFNIYSALKADCEQCFKTSKEMLFQIKNMMEDQGYTWALDATQAINKAINLETRNFAVAKKQYMQEAEQQAEQSAAHAETLYKGEAKAGIIKLLNYYSYLYDARGEIQMQDPKFFE
jgi:hypothetical protein